MHNLYIMWLYAFRFVACKVSVDASVCYIPSYYLQNCLYLVPLLLNGIGYLLAYVAVLFVTSVSVVKRAWLSGYCVRLKIS